MVTWVSYVVRKLVWILASIFVVASLTFFLMKCIPGDPFTQEQAIPEEILKSLYTHYGLDKPLFIQYLKYLKGIITWDFGPSFKFEGRTLNEIISEGFPISFILGSLALILSLGVGISLGSLGAFFHHRRWDKITMILAIIGLSVPSFILATSLQYLFGMKLKILPIARWGGFSHIIMPVLSLSFFPSAFIARLIRSKMIEILSRDYILAARAKGLSSFRIWKNHVLKNSFMPVLSYLGSISTNIFTGSFVVEKIFGIPGLGHWFVTSIINRDYTFIMGLTVFYSGVLMVTIFVIDIVYSIIDPRVRTKIYE
ncbi:MAG: peptide ABC transporter permease [Chlamydiae bacterium RIFCSPHIGHO2_12_FULL_49_11]|nr:MAG: peptide ABC transporter permease [Chlamydiae bacterium RIFCSPHIGHO2_12_FULL_49_11]